MGGVPAGVLAGTVGDTCTISSGWELDVWERESWVIASDGLGFIPALRLCSVAGSDKSSQPQLSHLCNGLNDISFLIVLKLK